MSDFEETDILITIILLLSFSSRTWYRNGDDSCRYCQYYGRHGNSCVIACFGCPKKVRQVRLLIANVFFIFVEVNFPLPCLDGVVVRCDS